MRKIILILTILLMSAVSYSQYSFKDTVEAGSSDSIYTPNLQSLPAFITLTFVQLDTNATSPDSVIIEMMGAYGYAGTLGFHKSATDSTLDVVKLTYSTSRFKHYSTTILGWVYQPYISGLRFRLFNAEYLAGRRILILGEYE